MLWTNYKEDSHLSRFKSFYVIRIFPMPHTCVYIYMCTIERVYLFSHRKIYRPLKCLNKYISQSSITRETIRYCVSNHLKLFNFPWHTQIHIRNFLCSWQIFTKLEEKTKKIQGARVEDNRFCISVHFRQVREEVKIFYLFFSFFCISVHCISSPSSYHGYPYY